MFVKNKAEARDDSCPNPKVFYYGARDHGVIQLGDGSIMVYDKKNMEGEWDQLTDDNDHDVLKELKEEPFKYKLEHGKNEYQYVDVI